MKIVFRSLAGAILSKDVEPTQTVLEFKQQLSGEYVFASLRLCHKGKLLEDGDTFAALGCDGNDTVVIIAGFKKRELLSNAFFPAVKKASIAKPPPGAAPATDTGSASLASAARPLLLLQDLSRAMQDATKFASSAELGGRAVLGPLTYADAAALLLAHPARTPSVEAAGWVCTGRMAQGTGGGEGSVTARDCYVKAVTLDGANATAWRGLSAVLTEGEAVTVKGESIDRLECEKWGAVLW